MACDAEGGRGAASGVTLAATQTPGEPEIVMSDTAEIGLIGLGTMGANLALNIARRGTGSPCSTARRKRRTGSMRGAGALFRPESFRPETPEAFVGALASPRTIVMMVPAGAPVSDQIAALRPHLSPGDVLIDGGNSDWTDSGDRAAALGGRRSAIPRLGISGGAEGARHGPSADGRGDKAAWEVAEPC